MHWIAPPEKDAATETLEKRLWSASDQLRAKVNKPMREIGKHNPQLASILPKTYNLLTSTLLEERLKKVPDIPATVDYDAFGRVYECFLGEYARTEGEKGGEPSEASSTIGTVARRASASDSASQFYTQSCIVRLLTEIIEPSQGRLLDPACGSGPEDAGFASSPRFVAEHKRQHRVRETTSPSVP